MRIYRQGLGSSGEALMALPERDPGREQLRVVRVEQVGSELCWPWRWAFRGPRRTGRSGGSDAGWRLMGAGC